MRNRSCSCEITDRIFAERTTVNVTAPLYREGHFIIYLFYYVGYVLLLFEFDYVCVTILKIYQKYTSVLFKTSLIVDKNIV